MSAHNFRSITRLPSTGCNYTDPKCQGGARNISGHGLCLRVPLHAQGKAIDLRWEGTGETCKPIAVFGRWLTANVMSQLLAASVSVYNLLFDVWPQALKLAGGQLLEPVMSLEVTVREEYLSSVLGDLAQRRGTVRDIQSRHDDKVLLATVPLAEIMVRWYFIVVTMLFLKQWFIL